METSAGRATLAHLMSPVKPQVIYQSHIEKWARMLACSFHQRVRIAKKNMTFVILNTLKMQPFERQPTRNALSMSTIS